MTEHLVNFTVLNPPNTAKSLFIHGAIIFVVCEDKSIHESHYLHFTFWKNRKSTNLRTHGNVLCDKNMELNANEIK
jgi:hypothetical protein